MLRRHLVQFWTLVAIFAAALSGSPQPAAAAGSVTLNEEYGDAREEPPRFVVYPSTIAMVYAGELGLGGTEAAPNAGWLYYNSGTLYGAPQLTALGTALFPADWTSATVTELEPNTAQQVLVGGSTTFTITWSTINTPFGATVESIEFAPIPSSGTHALYFVADTNLLDLSDNDFVGNDFGYGAGDPKDLLVTVEEDGWLHVGGITMVQSSGEVGPDTVMYGSIGCVFGSGAGSCPSQGPRGGAAYNGNQPSAADGAMGAYYNIVNNVITRSGFSLAALAFPVEGPVDEPPTDEEAAPVVEQCELLPDMAVSPERIDLTAGGTAEIEVALRNLCKDKPYSAADLLLSLNEQLQVTGVPAGWINLGSRAAWQNLALKPDETYRAVITVAAPNGMPAGPSHTWELYAQGRAQKRIDGVFIVPAAAPAPVVDAPAVPAVPAAPAPLPAALPNTSGSMLPLGALGLAALALTAAGAIRRRLR
jgi:hypothetical protein